MTTALLIAGMNFVYIFLKVMQQLNVLHSQYVWIVPTSIGMGLCEVTMILILVESQLTVAEPRQRYWRGPGRGARDEATRESEAITYTYPRCKNIDRLEFLVTVWAALPQNEDGAMTDPGGSEDGDHEWDEHNSMVCRACGY